MNWKEKLKMVAEKLGLTAKLEAKTISPEELQQILEAYEKDYQATLRDDIEAARNEEQQQAAKAEQQQLLNSIYAAVVTATGAQPAGAAAAQEGNATQQGIIKAIESLGSKLQMLAKQPDDDLAAKEGAAVIIPLEGFANTKDYIFGVNHKMFSMEDRWNQIAANPRIAAMLGEPTTEQEQAFYKAVRDFGVSLQMRMRQLVDLKATADLKGLMEGKYSTNFAGVDSLGDMGSQFVVRRQDAIIARVLATRAMTEFFPVRYGIQDNDLIFNAFFSEVSQAWQEGGVYKGSMTIDNLRGYVDDVMIKMSWGPMKDIERKYIGYLNKEGSDPIKWTMIEYQLLNSLLTAQGEQNRRRMRGIYVKPEEGKAGSYLNGSTGILYTLLRYVHEYKIKLNDDESYRSYTSSTMLTAVKEFISDVKHNLAEDETLDGKKLYLNKRHKDWWIKCIRAEYGKDIDFSGPDSYANHAPDTEMEIIWLPYLGELPFMMIQEPGNLQFLEYLPGEMMAVKMEQQMELVRAWSTWKEGTSAAFTGRIFSTKADMDANNFEWQQIFLNKFATDIDADATTVTAVNGFWQLTGENTQATAITNITGAKTGVAYCIECGSTTNASTIAKEGKFANIKEAWTPTAVGDYILVVLRSDGNFAELERCVGGTRTINKSLQPNIPA